MISCHKTEILSKFPGIADRRSGIPNRRLYENIEIDYNSVQFVLKKVINWHKCLITAEASNRIYLSSSALTFRGVYLLPGYDQDHII